MSKNISRVQLYEQLPLHIPFSLHVFPSYYCNFQCTYCIQSLDENELNNLSFKKKLMDFSIFKKAIDSLKEFDSPLKAIIFSGHGEPLVHKDIDKMVEYVKESCVADRIEIVTNGSLLTPNLSDKLISAGLDRLRISIQGVTEKKYKDVANVIINYNEFISNIEYFYQHKEDTEVYIKIIDIALESTEEEKKFKNIFSPISDSVSIEYAIPFVPEVDYSKFDIDSNLCKQGNTQGSSICSMPFYMLVLEPNGNIVPCCSTAIPVCFGNIGVKSFKEIWNSDCHKEFLRLQLNNKDDNLICKNCSVPAQGLQEGDYLDNYREVLQGYYE